MFKAVLRKETSHSDVHFSKLQTGRSNKNLHYQKIEPFLIFQVKLSFEMPFVSEEQGPFYAL